MMTTKSQSLMVIPSSSSYSCWATTTTTTTSSIALPRKVLLLRRLASSFCLLMMLWGVHSVPRVDALLIRPGLLTPPLPLLVSSSSSTSAAVVSLCFMVPRSWGGGGCRRRNSRCCCIDNKSDLLRCSMVGLERKDPSWGKSRSSFDGTNHWELPNPTATSTSGVEEFPPSSSSTSVSSGGAEAVTTSATTTTTTTTSTTTVEPLSNRFKNMHEINLALDQLAEACGPQQHYNQQHHSSSLSPNEIIAKAAQAEELWNQVNQHCQQQQLAAAAASTVNGNDNNPTLTFRPDVVAFNTVLKAWSKTAQSLADYKQQSVLFGAAAANPQSFINNNNNNNFRKYNNNNNNNQSTKSSSSFFSQTSAVDFTTIPVYTSRDAAERITMLLIQQEEVVDDDDESKQKHVVMVRPDTTSYNIAIDAWAKSRLDDAPQAAERLLQRMIQKRPDIQPDSLTYNGLVDAWSYSGRPESLSKLEQLYEQMVLLYEKQEQEQQKQKQQQQQDEGNSSPAATPTSSSSSVTNYVIRGQNNQHNNHHSRGSNRGDQPLMIKPTIRSVNSILHAHAKRAQEYAVKDPVLARRAADDARGWLRRMTAKYEATHDVDFQPDVTSYTTVMDAYGRCATYEATLEAETLLQELKDLFRRTKNIQRHEPNIRTYTTLISAWAKVGNVADEAPQRAQALLEEIKSLKHHNNNNNNNTKNNNNPNQQQQVGANARTYLAVIQCWARSRDPTKAQRALQILLTMKDLYKTTQNPEVRPNLVTYNAAIDACAKCQGTSAQQTDALKIAFAILKAIQAEPDMQANQVTFATLLKATAALMPAGEERNKVAQAVFAKAQRAGVVDNYTLTNLRKAVEVNVLTSLLKDMQDRQGVIDYQKIPQAWCKNVLSVRQ